MGADLADEYWCLSCCAKAAVHRRNVRDAGVKPRSYIYALSARLFPMCSCWCADSINDEGYRQNPLVRRAGRQGGASGFLSSPRESRAAACRPGLAESVSKFFGQAHWRSCMAYFSRDVFMPAGKQCDVALITSCTIRRRTPLVCASPDATRQQSPSRPTAPHRRHALRDQTISEFMTAQAVQLPSSFDQSKPLNKNANDSGCCIRHP